VHQSLAAPATLFAALALAACGGGSGGDAARPAPAATATAPDAKPKADAGPTAAAPAAAPAPASPAPAAAPTAAVGDAGTTVAGHPELSARTYQPDGPLIDLGKDVANNTGFLDHWIVLGPFPNPGGRETFDDPTPDWDKAEPNFHKDFLAGCGGEHDVLPKLGTKTTVDGNAFAWEPMVTPSGEIVDIRQHYETTQRAFLHTIAYLADYIEVDQPQKVSFGIGSDDGYILWVNGEFVSAHHIHRGATLDDDFVPVALRKGTNLILMKVDTDLGGWGALVRIVGKDYAEVHGIKEYAPPVPAAAAPAPGAAPAPAPTTPAAPAGQ
jgi:hypothetical protein